MPLTIFTLLAAVSDPAGLIESYRSVTRAETPCTRPATPQEVSVCGRREADKRYRVPFVTPSVAANVPKERDALLAPPMRGCGRVGTSLSDCGFAGVHISTDGASVELTTRKLAD